MSPLSGEGVDDLTSCRDRQEAGCFGIQPHSVSSFGLAKSAQHGVESVVCQFNGIPIQLVTEFGMEALPNKLQTAFKDNTRRGVGFRCMRAGYCCGLLMRGDRGRQ